MALSTKTKSKVNIDDVPTTTDDFSELFKWQYGDEIYGTQAGSSVYAREYIRDIVRAVQSGNEKDIYIDTFRSIGKQLKKYKKRII